MIRTGSDRPRCPIGWALATVLPALATVLPVLATVLPVLATVAAMPALATVVLGLVLALAASRAQWLERQRERHLVAPCDRHRNR